MDTLAIAISVLSIVIGTHILKRAQERAERQDVVCTLIERLNRYVA